LKSYVTALRYTFALGVPVAGVAFLASFFIPWFKFQNVGENLKKTSVKPEALDGSR
jgi:hypothetical protein